MSLTQVLDRFTAVVDELLATDLTPATSGELVDFLREFETQKRRLPTVDHALVVELDQRGVAGELMARDTKTLLRDVLRLSPREAKARYVTAVDLGPRASMTGEPLPPLFPATAVAQAAGVISPDHVRVIRRCIETLPAAVEAEHGPAVEAQLVEEAGRFDPDELAKLARRIHAHLHPDGVLADDREHDRQRHATLTPHRDGSGELHAHLTPGCLALWQAVLDPLAKPRPADESGPDDRSPGQRLHDALEECAIRLLDSGTLPDCGGTRATVVLHMTADQYTTGQGYATTGHGGLISIPEAVKLAGQADLYAVLKDADNGVLDYWRTRRLATPGQRIALAARDGGCCFPGCGQPPSRCQVHHTPEWTAGGNTNLDEMCLLCHWHHKEFDNRGWSVQIKNGTPEWTPPRRVDPEQKPRRNTIHHPLRE